MERLLEKRQVGTKALDTNRSKKRKIRECSEFYLVCAFLR